ncbi:hypothetical protein [Nocardia wallacei]|uniref:hypothetical protein n=1 Tax=Nocardia wallacei TaxID=480035 RepID=UPI0024551BE8|nr:hypothetical protein [Nocardia wallacei]
MARKNNVPVEIRAEAQRNRNKALEMRLAGKTQAQIAAETGWSKQRVSTYIKKAIADITRENAEEYIELELSRLDELQAALWKEATSGNKWSEQKVDRIIAIIDQRARLLGTYKAVELKAIADAKGKVGEESQSMVGQLVQALHAAYTMDKAAQDADSDDSDEDDE